MTRGTKDTSLETSLRKVVDALRRSRVPYMVIGALALSAWGRPRATMDFDVMIAADSIPERLVRNLLQARFKPDLDWADHNPMLRGFQTRFRSGRVAVDILLPRDRHDRQAFENRKKRRFNDYFLWFPSAEDLMLQKLKVGRPQDFSDAAGIAERCSGQLNRRYLDRWARQLGITAELRHVIGAQTL